MGPSSTVAHPTLLATGCFIQFGGDPTEIPLFEPADKPERSVSLTETLEPGLSDLVRGRLKG